MASNVEIAKKRAEATREMIDILKKNSFTGGVAIVLETLLEDIEQLRSKIEELKK